MRRSTLTLISALVAAGALDAQAPRSFRAPVAQFDPKEWAVPFGAETRPRDPYVDAQGRVWFVGQAGNYVAYLESATGAFKRFEIEPGTHPHNLVVEKGMVWFTGNRNGRIVRLDPATGKLTTFMIPDAAVSDPHTMVFDPKSGIAWFSAQNSNAVGRFDPATGKFRFWKTGADTRPYGVVIDSKGNPWFDLFGTNKIATVDSRTLELREFELPDAKAHPRRIAITSRDQIYWGDYTRGFLGHLDPATGKMQEWALPAGPASLPYAMTTDDSDVIWIAQAGRQDAPATLVAFDPATSQFVAEVPVGRPGANTIRHMTFDKARRQIWFGTDQGSIGRISVPPRALVP